MKRLSYLMLLSTCVVVTACGDPADKMINKNVAVADNSDIELSSADIFDGMKVFEFLKNKNKFVQEANELFLKGLDAFKNDQNLDSAEFYFTQSLVKEPNARTYCELGNVYKQRGEYSKAIDSYMLSEQLDYAPFSKILYNIATVYSLKEEAEQAGKYLEYAMQAGYNNLESIEKDPELDYLRSSYMFRESLNRGLRGMSDPEKLFWLQFKKQFPKTNMPITLNWDLPSEKLEEMEYVSYDFEKYISEMRDEKFSREVSKGFYYFAQVMETEEFVAVIYIMKDEFLGDVAPLTYRLATFTHTGKIIDKYDIAGRSNLNEDVRLATLKSNGAIDVDVIALQYEKDPDEHGYWDNKVKSTQLKGREKYQIKSTGKIQKLSETLASI